MSRRDDPYGHAMAENFFRRRKYEQVHPQRYDPCYAAQAEAAKKHSCRQKRDRRKGHRLQVCFRCVGQGLNPQRLVLFSPIFPFSIRSTGISRPLIMCSVSTARKGFLNPSGVCAAAGFKGTVSPAPEKACSRHWHPD